MIYTDTVLNSKVLNEQLGSSFSVSTLPKFMANLKKSVDVIRIKTPYLDSTNSNIILFIYQSIDGSFILTDAKFANLVLETVPSIIARRKIIAKATRNLIANNNTNLEQNELFVEMPASAKNDYAFIADQILNLGRIVLVVTMFPILV